MTLYLDSVSANLEIIRSCHQFTADLTWSLPVMTGSLPVLNHRVSRTSQQDQPGNTCRQAVNTNLKRALHNRQAGNCVGQANFIFTTHDLSAFEICDYIKRVSLHNASFGIWHLTDYIWQHFKNRSLFFNNCLGQF